MSTIQQWSNLDFRQSAQLINVVLQKVTTNPTAWEGGLVYNTTDDLPYWSDGVDWYPITGGTGTITNVIGGGGIIVDVNGDDVTVTFDPDDNTLELSGTGNTAVARIKEEGVTTIHLADESVVFSKIQEIPNLTVIGNVSGEEDIPSVVTILTNLDTTIAEHDSLATARSVKEYINEVVGDIGQFQGGHDASTELFPSGSTMPGDYWYITVAGTIDGHALNVGDVIIAKQENASTTDSDEWVILVTKKEQATTEVLGVVRFATNAEALGFTETQRALTPSNLAAIRATDSEVQTGDTITNKFITPSGLSTRVATTGSTGLIQIATQQEVFDGVDDEKAVTPETLKAVTDEIEDGFGSYSEVIGDDSTTIFTITHNLDSEDVLVQVRLEDTGGLINVLTTILNEDQISVSFNDAPDTNQFKVIVKK